MVSSATAPERRHTFTYEEYIRIAEHSDIRLEFWGGVIFDMAGGSPRHSAICNNIGGILRAQLRGGPCRAYDANLRVRSNLVTRATYADATVVCGPLEIDPDDKTRQTVLNPAVVVEVHSPSTMSDDRGPKLDCYQTIASMKTIVLVAQDERQITVYDRHPDGRWSETVHTDGSVEIATIGCSLPVEEVYEDLPD